mmetsp:Transcript_142814/g.397818  ORF Transcript_142814/g.397818 Transcript_142814/m.397818 type:complete len:207 (-) Transcript_142814:921-1541(-)
MPPCCPMLQLCSLSGRGQVLLHVGNRALLLIIEIKPNCPPFLRRTLQKLPAEVRIHGRQALAAVLGVGPAAVLGEVCSTVQNAYALFVADGLRCKNHWPTTASTTPACGDVIHDDATAAARALPPEHQCPNCTLVLWGPDSRTGRLFPYQPMAPLVFARMRLAPGGLLATSQAHAFETEPHEMADRAHGLFIAIPRRVQHGLSSLP